MKQRRCRLLSPRFQVKKSKLRTSFVVALPTFSGSLSVWQGSAGKQSPSFLPFHGLQADTLQLILWILQRNCDQSNSFARDKKSSFSSENLPTEMGVCKRIQKRKHHPMYCFYSAILQLHSDLKPFYAK